MGEFIFNAQLVHNGCGLTSADDGGGIKVCHSFCNGKSTFSKGFHFKYAHGTIPYHGFHFLQCFYIKFNRLRTDIQCHPRALEFRCRKDFCLRLFR